MQYAYDKLSINKRNQNSQKGPKTVLVAQLYPTLCDPMDCSLCPWNSPGKTTGVGSHFLLQEIFLTQESNLDRPHCRQILDSVSHKGSPLKVSMKNLFIKKKKTLFMHSFLYSISYSVMYNSVVKYNFYI